MLSEQRLIELLTDLEADSVERTISVGNTDKFAQAICAFANDLSKHGVPGYLFIGVRDDGSPCGLKVTDELLKNLAAIRSDGNVLPQPVLTVQKYTLDDGELAVVEVQPSHLPPVRYTLVAEPASQSRPRNRRSRPAAAFKKGAQGMS